MELTNDSSNPLEKSIATMDRPNRKLRMRYWVCFGGLVLALIVAALVGWNDASLVLSAFACFVPFLIGIGILVFQGRNFSIRTMLVAMAFLALGVTWTIQPLLASQRDRETTYLLEHAQVSMFDSDALSQFYWRNNINSASIDTAETASVRMPNWVALASRAVAQTPPSREIRFVHTHTGEQLKLVCDQVDDLPNLRVLSVSSSTSSDIEYLLNRIDDFKSLEAITFHESQIPNEGLEKLKRIPFLIFYRPNTKTIPIDATQLKTLTESTDLKSLTSQFVTDNEFKCLLNNKTLRQLWLHESVVSPGLLHEFMDSNPDCRILFDSNRDGTGKEYKR